MKKTVFSCLFIFLFSNLSIAPAQEIVWRDEFNSGRLDRDVWIHDVGGHGFGNAQLEFNTARNANSYVDDGKLVIEAKREKYQRRKFTSARLSTQGRFAFQYGSLVARVKVPDTANGVWPAFWLLGDNFPAINWPMCGEADILEVGSKEGIAEGLQHRKINAALHFADISSKKKSLVKWHVAPKDLHTDFHLYQVDWTPKSMVFKLDGIEFAKWDLTTPEFREFHQPYFPLINVAVGSFKHTYTGIDSPDQVTAKFPSRMYVDWIRLYANPHTKVFLGKDKIKKGEFGVYTESPWAKLSFATKDNAEFEYGEKARFDSWNNLSISEIVGGAPEGVRHYRLTTGEQGWFGGGILVSSYRNMSQYSDGNLHFSIRTRSKNDFRVGIKSSRGGESWLPIGNSQKEFGFKRDGKWHIVTLPLNRFGNIDFHTIHQFFMITGETGGKSVTVDIDNIWWEPGAPRPKITSGNFGIFTHVPEHQSGGNFKSDFDRGFYVWENTLEFSKEKEFKGRSSIRLAAKEKNWTGAAFSPNVKYDLSGFDTESSVLHFAIRTKTNKEFKIGMKSGNVESVGQFWMDFNKGSDPKTFQNDGNWHVVEIPMAKISREVDLSAVSHFFQVLSTEGAIETIEFADICILKKNQEK